MKIICKNCNKLIGEIDPLDDYKKTKAKCTDCIKKEKDEQLKKLVETPLAGKEKSRVVKLENGAQGLLTIAGKETPELGFWGILFEGREFLCCEETRKDFYAYLESLQSDELDITCLHSMSVIGGMPQKKRGKRNSLPPVEPLKSESIQYNCTVRGNKDFARHVFKTKEEQLKQYLDIVAPVVERLAREEQKLQSS